MGIWYWKWRGTKLNNWKYELILQSTEIIELNHKVEGNGIYITDMMHVFKANNQIFQSESEQQKIGYYFCWKIPKTLSIQCPYQRNV